MRPCLKLLVYDALRSFFSAALGDSQEWCGGGVTQRGRWAHEGVWGHGGAWSGGGGGGGRGGAACTRRGGRGDLFREDCDEYVWGGEPPPPRDSTHSHPYPPLSASAATSPPSTQSTASSVTPPPKGGGDLGGVWVGRDGKLVGTSLGAHGDAGGGGGERTRGGEVSGGKVLERDARVYHFLVAIFNCLCGGGGAAEGAGGEAGGGGGGGGGIERVGGGQVRAGAVGILCRLAKAMCEEEVTLTAPQVHCICLHSLHLSLLSPSVSHSLAVSHCLGDCMCFPLSPHPSTISQSSY